MLKRSLAIAVICSLLLAGCGEPLRVENKTYPTWGLMNESTDRSDKMCYKISVGNVIWSIILVETIIMPVYFIGWSIMNPVRMKQGPGDDCRFDPPK